MRICILTQPLSTNYGGLLQAYALQKVLKNMGHEVWTEDRKPNKSNFFHKIKQCNLVRSLFGKKHIHLMTNEQKKIINKNTNFFIKHNIQTTCPIDSKNKRKLGNYKFDAYIVGSDQVWRPCYSYGIYNYFLDFTKGQNVHRLAYAASFGVSEWEFTRKQTCKCRKLIKNFNNVSVREDSAVILCKSKFDINAVHVLDPTMLLTKEDYISMINTKELINKTPNIFVYILDKSKNKISLVDKISSHFKLSTNFFMPNNKFWEVDEDNIDKCVYPSVENWIKGFVDAEFVITDSFHGTVFAILFNKPFISIANNDRGVTRFTSLLNLFGLSNRLILESQSIDSCLLNQTFDYVSINNIISEMKKKSISFLVNGLK